MKHLVTVLLLFVGYADVSAQDLDQALVPFKVLQGSWALKDEKGQLIEIWEFKDSSSFSGRSYRINVSGDSTLLETVILKADASGVFYVVEGQNDKRVVSFKLISAKNNTFIFENKENDFPQRIIYQFRGEEDLLAWIEGKQDGKMAKIEFPYKRVAMKL